MISLPEGRGEPIESNKNYWDHDEIENHTCGKKEGRVEVGEGKGRRNRISRLKSG